MKFFLKKLTIVLLSLGLIPIVNSCKKDKPPSITTTNVTSISYTTATSGGNVTNEGSSPVVSRGVCWKTSPGPTIDNNKTIESGGSGAFTSDITQLTQSTKYYLKAYGTNVAGTGYGNEVSFTTQPVTTAVLITDSITNISQFSATVGGTVIDGRGAVSFLTGICWSKNETHIVVVDSNKDNYCTFNDVRCDVPCSFTCSIGGSGTPPLSANTTYYVRAFVEDYAIISYGNILSFTTLPLPIVVPQTKPVTNIMQTTAICGGNVISDFDTTLKAKGACWSTGQNPSISDNNTTDGSGGGDFVSRLSGLTPNTTYYVRAYATNNGGTGYGTVMSFTTLSITVPGLITANITYITKTSAICGGTISSEGATDVTERGVCWSSAQNPTISDKRTSDGMGPGDFVSTLTGLNIHTKYYIRSYATYSKGTVYGAEINFTTNGSVTDIDSNVYNTVTIGTQEWMAENLKTTKYQNGTSLLSITNGIGSGPPSIGGYCSYQNKVIYVKEYGYLYNLNAVVDNRNLCPTGWHVPSDTEWETLINYLGGKAIAGGKLKETGTSHWDSPNTGATNESGFSALPGGQWFAMDMGTPDHPTYSITFVSLGFSGEWWSNNADSFLMITEQSANAVFYSNGGSHNEGFSVRCIKN